MTKMDAETLYRQFGLLAETMPDLYSVGPFSAETNRWMGRAFALLGELGHFADQAQFQNAWDRASKYLHDRNDRRERADLIANIFQRALAVAELRAPVSSQGAFIATGNQFDAFAGIAKVLGSARRNVMIVDPYMDEKTLTDFAPTAPENVSIQLLSDSEDHKPSLIPAVQRWRQQHAARALEARLTPDDTLHDRLIIVDGETAYTVTQSLKDLAVKSPATIVRVDDPDMRRKKIETYQKFWDSAEPIK